MSTAAQYDARQAAEHASLVRWFSFTDQVEANIHRMVGDVLRHERLVMGEGGENAYVCCTHGMHHYSGHWIERQSWPCPELLHAAGALGIDIDDNIRAQRQLDELAYGPALDPAERRRRWEETLPPGLRSPTKN